MRSRLWTTAAGASTGALCLILTRGGILLEPDSATYLWTSRFLRASPGGIFDLPYDTTLSARDHFPPLYPAVLAVAGALGDDLVAARVVGVLLATVAAALLFRLVASHASTAAALLVVALVFLSRSYTIVLFGFLMSDGMFVMLALVVVSILDAASRSASDSRAISLIMAAGAVAGLAFLTRLDGVGLVVSMGAIVLFGLRPRRRVGLACAAVAVAVAPVVVWMVAQSGPGSVGGRHLGWYPPSLGMLATFEAIPWSYLPRPVLATLGPTGMRLIGIVVFAALAWWSAARLRAALASQASPGERTVGMLLVVGWVHLATLLVSRVLFDPFIWADGRHGMVWLTFIAAAGGIDVHRRLVDGRVRDRLRRAVPVVVAAMLVGAAIPLARSVADPTDSWWNYAMVPESRLVAEAERRVDDGIVYSNREDTIYLQAGMTTRSLALERRLDGSGLDPTFERRTLEMAREVRAGRAFVVLFTDNPAWSVDVDLLVELAGLRVDFRNEEGVILVRGTGHPER